jgi:hypothetical protein
MFNLRTALGAGSIAALTLLSGCIGGGLGLGGGGPNGAASSGVEGDWIGSDGVAVSTLQGGRFSSRSLTTGEVLTEGSYSHRDQQTIDLSFYSRRTQQNTQATCLVVGPEQMNCTLASGSRFILTRRSSVS